MWIELGLFLLVLIFGIHQIRDVRKEQRKRAEREHVEKNELKWGLRFLRYRWLIWLDDTYQSLWWKLLSSILERKKHYSQMEPTDNCVFQNLATLQLIA